MSLLSPAWRTGWGLACWLPTGPGPDERTRAGRGPDTVTGRYLGVDVGTSATKVSLVTEDTTLTASAGYPTRHGRAALTWQDTRASAELAARFGDPEPLIGTALPWSALPWSAANMRPHR